ncbi:hypothetical protein FCV25MIE_14732 [Fagus crenata]
MEDCLAGRGWIATTCTAEASMTTVAQWRIPVTTSSQRRTLATLFSRSADLQTKPLVAPMTERKRAGVGSEIKNKEQRSAICPDQAAVRT